MSSESDERKEADASSSWCFWKWRDVALASFVLLLLTQDPILTGVLPYLRAGWPAVRTAFWLKAVDPWKARATVGMLFHLCMAGFRAGICGFVCLMGLAVAMTHFNRPPHMISTSIAIGSILCGCVVSLILGAAGIMIALQHQVRIYAMSDLYERCHGDFEKAKFMSVAFPGVNPTNFIVAIAAATPLLGLWFALLVISSVGNPPGQPSTFSIVVAATLPLIGLGAVLAMSFLQKRIIAKSPAECWGAEIPLFEEPEHNWYRA